MVKEKQVLFKLLPINIKEHLKTINSKEMEK
jgi:hypothetical protein